MPKLGRPERETEQEEVSRITAEPVTTPAESWLRRVDRVMASDVPRWRQTQLKQIRDDLVRITRDVSEESDATMLLVLERVQWFLGDESGAMDALQRRYEQLARTRNPDELARHAYDQAADFSQHGLDDAARHHYAQVVRFTPSDPLALMADHNIGVILRRSGRFQEAERYFLGFATKYRSSHPEYARRAQYLAADCAWRAGQPQRALELFRSVISDYPGTPEADNANHMVTDISKGERPEDGIQVLQSSPNPVNTGAEPPREVP